MTNDIKNENLDTFKLPAAVTEQLKAMQRDMTRAENTIKSLSKLGMDVTKIQEQLDWAKEMRDTLLKDFSK